MAERQGNVRLEGKLNFNDSIFQQGRNEDAIEAVVITVGGKKYTSGLNREDFSFHIDIPQHEYDKLAGQALEYSFITSGNVHYLEGTGSSKTVRSMAATSTQAQSELAKISLDFNADAPVRKVDGKTLIDTNTHTSTVVGTVSGAAKAGDTVRIEIGGKSYQTKVSDSLTFSVEVDNQALSAVRSQDVKAVLHTHDLSGKAISVSDVAVFTQSSEISGSFVSRHTPVDISQRVTTHTDPNYNYAYFLHTVTPRNADYYGYLKYGTTPFGGYDSNGQVKPIVLKYYYATLDDYASGRATIHANNIEAGSHAEFSDYLKNLIRTVYNQYESVSNLRFEETNNISEANAILMYARFANGMAGSGAYAFAGGNTVFNTRYFTDNPSGLAYKKYLTMHEFMHTFEAFHTDGEFSKLTNAAGEKYAQAEDNSSEFGSMSYAYSYHSSNDPDHMTLYDMAYIHYRFGVNQEARTGNDVYSFGSYASLVGDGNIYVWDGGGIDTFDASAEKEGVIVNLTPGSWNYRVSQLSDVFIAKSKHTIAANDYKTYFADQNLEGVSISGNMAAHTYHEYVTGQSFIGYGTQIENLNGSQFADILTGNAADNIISGNGGDDIIKGGAGNDYLDGGAGKDHMEGGAGDDRYVIDDEGDTVIEEADGGEDTVYSHISHTLGAHFEHLSLLGSDNINGTGNDLDNTLTGNSGANVLNGGLGNDTINGGRGADTLTGGAGADVFVFDSVLDGSIDTITDFGLEDTIRLDGTIFSALGLGGSVSDHVRYHSGTGLLSYDPDAAGAADPIYFAKLSTGLSGVEERIEVV